MISSELLNSYCAIFVHSAARESALRMSPVIISKYSATALANAGRLASLCKFNEEGIISEPLWAKSACVAGLCALLDLELLFAVAHHKQENHKLH